MTWRFWVFLVVVDLLFLAGLYLTTGGVYKLTNTAWTVKLPAGCEMDFRTSVGVVALACPGVNYMRVWLLPVVQPWESTPDPVEGWMAERGGAAEASPMGYVGEARWFFYHFVRPHLPKVAGQGHEQNKFWASLHQLPLFYSKS